MMNHSYSINIQLIPIIEIPIINHYEPFIINHY